MGLLSEGIYYFFYKAEQHNFFKIYFTWTDSQIVPLGLLQIRHKPINDSFIC